MRLDIAAESFGACESLVRRRSQRRDQPLTTPSEALS